MADSDPAARAGKRVQRRRTGREIIKQFLQKTFVAVVLTIAVVYACDFLLLRFRIATNRQPYGTVTIHPYYAVPQKNHKTEYLFDDPRDERCVHSLFPHVGDSPCWYLSRNKDRRINI